MDAPAPTTAAGVKEWALLGAGFALGFAVSKAVLRLEKRIAGLLTSSLKVDAGSAGWTAYLIAIAVYLALAVAFFRKDHAAGYFAAGFFGGALVETALQIPATPGA